MGGIDCVRDSKIGTPYPPLSGPTPRNGKSVSHVFSTVTRASVFFSPYKQRVVNRRFRKKIDFTPEVYLPAVGVGL